MKALGRTTFLSLLLLLSISTIATADPISTYYISAYDTNRVYMVNGHTVTSFAVTPSETPIAISDGTIRMQNYFLNTGHVYDLNGNVVGTTGTTNLSGMKIYDATTDGTYNYFVFGNSGNVYRTDLNYTNPTLLFTAQAGAFITYDPTNNSLWLSGGHTPTWQASTLILDYDLNGNLLSSFNTTSPYNYALAFDPADSTLWVTNPVAPSYLSVNLVQYSRSGEVLDTLNLALGARSAGQFGGEFQELAYVPPVGGGSVPEPATLVLLGSGLCGLGALKRRH